MEVVVTTRLLELQAVQSSGQIITTNKPTSSFLQARCPSCRPTNNVKALKEKYHIPWTCLPEARLGVFQLCLWALTAPGYLGGGLPCLSSSLWCQYPNAWNEQNGLKLEALRMHWTLSIKRSGSVHKTTIQISSRLWSTHLESVVHLCSLQLSPYTASIMLVFWTHPALQCYPPPSGYTFVSVSLFVKEYI